MRQTFSEFEHFTDVIGHADANFTLPRLDTPFWSISQRSIGQIHLQCGTEANGNIAEASAHDGGYLLFVQRDGSPCQANGVPLEEDMLLVSGPRGEFVLAADKAHDWYSLFVPSHLLTPRGTAEEDLPVGPRSARVLRPGLRSLTNLHSIVDRLQETEQKTPESFLEPASVANAERELVRTVRDILSLRESPSASLATAAATARSSGPRGRPPWNEIA